MLLGQELKFKNKLCNLKLCTFFSALLMRGVKIVSDSPVSRSAALEDVPNAETLAAMKEAESGHDAGVVRVDSLESFMASMEE